MHSTMTTTEPKNLYATLAGRGAFDDPVGDGALDDLLSIVGTAICRLSLALDDALNPDGVSHFDDAFGEDVDAVLATLDRAVAVYARLLPLAHARRDAVECQGIGWEDHIDQIDQWKIAVKKAVAA